MAYKLTRLDAANCNARLVRLVRVDYDDDTPSEFVVAHPGDRIREDEGDTFDNEAEARTAYQAAVKHWLAEPNWEAQAR